MQKRLILFGLLFLSTSLFGFASSLNLADAINQIRKQGVQIIYSDQYLKVENFPVDERALKYTIGDLKKHLNSIDFELIKIKQSLFIIKPLKGKKDNNSTGKGKGIVIVTLYDESTKQRIQNANITVISQTSANVFGSTGVYSVIDLTPKKHELKIVSYNYVSKTHNVDLTNNEIYSVDIFLNPLPKTLDSVLVTTSKYSFILEDSASKKILYAEELKRTPIIGNDPTRAISRLPGLTSSGISARSYTRGGKLDESGIIFNGLNLNNPFHFNDFFGIFSIIDLSYTQDLALYTGVFPAKFGNYISSVMEITSIQPDRPLFVDGSIGLFNSHITIGGELSNFSSYIASFRSGGDFFKEGLLSVNAGNPEYDDAFISLSRHFDNGIKIQGNLLFSSDDITIDIANENETANASSRSENIWLSIEDSRFDSATINGLLYFQNNKSNRIGTVNGDTLTGSISKNLGVQEYGLSTDIKFNLSQNTFLTVGGSWSRLQSNTLFDLSRNSLDFLTQLLNQERIINRNYDLNLTGTKYSFYSDFRYQHSPSLFVDVGMRFDSQSWIEKQQISPRVNVSYFYNHSTTIRFGYGRQQQTQNIDSFLFEDSELLYFNPEVADVFILEMSKQLDSDLSIRAEAYYKNYQHVQPYYENMFVGLQLNPELFADRIRVAPNAAKAKGVDITITKEFQNVSTSIAYSFANIYDLFDEGRQNRSWDQRNSLKLNASWQYKKWDVNSLLTYRNGWPRTNLVNSDELTIGERNIDSYNDFINLDFRIERQLQFKTVDGGIWFQLTNALNRSNQCCTEYSYLPDENNQFVLSARSKKWLPMIPSVGINFYFD